MHFESAVLIIDPLELRRAAILSVLAPWADCSKQKLVPVGSLEDLAQAGAAAPVAMILLVIGARRIAEPETQNMITSLQKTSSNAPIVLLSDREEPDQVVAAYKAGVRGFIPMNVGSHVTVQSLTFILSGGTFFPPTALLQSAHGGRPVNAVASHGIRMHQVVDGLTPRQQEVLERLRRGESNKQIARQLVLSVSTVKVHIRQIMRKLGARNRTQIALCAYNSNKTTTEEQQADGEQREDITLAWRRLSMA
jgi:DNA-binding NarL/FixJ family response regulator